MYHFMNQGSGWNWGWMIPTMILWVAVIGGVVYGAVRLAQQDRRA